MKRALRIGAVALLTAVVLGGGFRLVRTIAFFDIRRIELVGGHYLTPAAVARELAVPPGTNVFGDLDPFTARVGKMAGVRAARVSRRLPGTLRVTVEEAEAVALTERNGRLVLLDTRGKVLPFDPTSPAADLPLAEADPSVTGVLQRVRDTDPELFRGIGEGRRLRQDVALTFAEGRMLLRADATPEDIRDLALIRGLLAREGTPWRELDGRYSSRVIVRGRDG